VEGTQSEQTPQANPFISRLRRFLASRGKMRRLLGFARSKFDQPVPRGFRFSSLTEFLCSKEYPVTTLDYFDSRADLRYDMNQPVPEGEHNRYGTLIDIGSLEHLFDTAGCLENCFRMVRRGATTCCTHQSMATLAMGCMCLIPTD
jgi:hypothetical protein